MLSRDGSYLCYRECVLATRFKLGSEIVDIFQLKLYFDLQIQVDDLTRRLLWETVPIYRRYISLNSSFTLIWKWKERLDT